MEQLLEIPVWIQKYGPWAMLVILGLAYWKQDAYIKRLHARLLDTFVGNTKAVVELSAVVGALKDAFGALANKL